MDNFLLLVLIGGASGNIALFLTKSALLNAFHNRLEAFSPKLEELFSCPWCLSHWVGAAFMLIYRPDTVIHSAQWYLRPADYLVTLMVIVLVAVLVARMVYGAVKSFER